MNLKAKWQLSTCSNTSTTQAQVTWLHMGTTFMQEKYNKHIYNKNPQRIPHVHFLAFLKFSIKTKLKSLNFRLLNWSMPKLPVYDLTESVGFLKDLQKGVNTMTGTSSRETYHFMIKPTLSSNLSNTYL